MWLLDTTSLELKSFEGENVPKYAILSHTWGIEELRFQDIISLNASDKGKAGYTKIRNFCRLAKEEHGLYYGWIDTCCINKESSADLSEAINSMYKWYNRADVCLIYLADVPDASDKDLTSRMVQADAFRASKWWIRGWTLQELVACSRRTFYCQSWGRLDFVGDDQEFTSIIHDLTGISSAVLTSRGKLRDVCVAERMSWLAHRQTTRAEDMAYCLMGVFDVNMPILYGEGLHSAFKRLQEEIMKSSFDQTLFAWRQDYDSSGLLAGSPKDFQNTPELGLWAPFVLSPSITTNIGILFRACILPKHSYPQETNEVDGVIRAALQCDVKTEQGWMMVVLRLRLVRDVIGRAYGQPRRAYRRVDCHLWEAIPSRFFDGRDYTEILVLGNDNHDLLHVASRQDLARRLADSWGSQPLIMSRGPRMDPSP